MAGIPQPSREAPARPPVAPQAPSGWPTQNPAALGPLRGWVPWAVGAAGLLVMAVIVVLAMQLASARHGLATLEMRTTALAGEVEALRAGEAAAALRATALRAQLEDLRRQVDALSVRAPTPAPPPQTVPRVPPPPAPPRAPGR